MKFVGWMVLGLLLGPSLLNWSQPSWYSGLAQVAGGLFLFLAGWELRFLELRREARFYLGVLLGCFVIPVLAGLFFFQGNVFIGVALGISALPVAIQILKEKKMYDSRLARRAITLASICDIFAWITLAFLLPTDKVSSWLLSHWVIFAFFIGLLFGRIKSWPESARLSRLQMWILAPLFFVGLGWKINIVELFDIEVFLKLLAVAVFAKGVGTYVAARCYGESKKEAWNLAAILNARGAMEVLAANYAYQAGIIDGGVFAGLVLVGIVTSLMAVPAVRN